MTTGTVTPFLELPEDITPPKPGYFHNVFHMVRAYLELVRNVPENSITPGLGLVGLYGYRMGVLDLDTGVIEKAYLNLVKDDKTQQQVLCSFGQSAIAYNLVTLYKLLSNTITRDLKRGFGDDTCLTSELVQLLNQMALAVDRKDVTKQQIHDSIEIAARSCEINALSVSPVGVSSSEAIFRTIDALDKIVELRYNESAADLRRRLTFVLKVIFFIGTRYYKLKPLRFSDEIIKRSYDRSLKITDFTLAAVPFEPTLIYACGDGTSSISRWGIEYVQALDAVLLYFGGVRYSATLAIEANGNKGV